MIDKLPDVKYKVAAVDLDYYQGKISCQAACPVRTGARGYVDAIADGDYAAGYIQARQSNPFTSIRGRICASPCERA